LPLQFHLNKKKVYHRHFFNLQQNANVYIALDSSTTIMI